MKVHLVDGTYELFRCYFGAPSKRNSQNREVGATRALVRSLAGWLRSGEVTHLACAFDTVIESFRNDLFAGYKTGEGIEAELHSQFPLVEKAVAALGIVVWPMKEFEADDAIATAARKFAKNKAVEAILLCSPDKDLAQCIGRKIYGYDRREDERLDAAGVVAKYGVPPDAIPDLLALVGDTADGIPGIKGWGMKSAAAVLAAYGDLEKIPDDPGKWKVVVRGAAKLAATLASARKEALLYRKLATLRFDVPLKETVAHLEWRGADREALESIAVELADPELVSRVELWK